MDVYRNHLAKSGTGPSLDPAKRRACIAARTLGSTDIAHRCLSTDTRKYVLTSWRHVIPPLIGARIASNLAPVESFQLSAKAS